jgi:hypothetical protein
VAAAAGVAADKTDQQLASQIATIGKLSPESIRRLYPDPADARKFEALVSSVKSSTSQNEKINHLVANSEQFAGVIPPLLQKLVWVRPGALVLKNSLTLAAGHEESPT